MTVLASNLKPQVPRRLALRVGGPLPFAILLVIVHGGYAAVCAFWHYLLTGCWIGFTGVRHYASLLVGQMLLQPLSIFEHPWMIAVCGLLLGAVILVPVVMSVLYRPGWALPLVVLLAVLAQAPILAAVLGISCVLAGKAGLRRTSPSLTACLGLLPAGAYLALFGLSGSDNAAIAPLRRWILHVPLLMAMVSALAVTWATMWLARMARYYPAAIIPILSLVLAAPIAIFHLRVGSERLAFALLCQSLDGGEALLAEKGLDRWRLENKAQGLTGQALLNRLEDDLKGRRLELQGRCDEFLARFGGGELAPSALWIRAEAGGLRLDRRALDQGRVRYSADHPLPAGEEDWRRLRESFPGSLQAAMAGWRLAELALRAKNVNQAEDLLTQAAERLERFLAAPEPNAGEVFSSTPQVPSRAQSAEALFQVQRLAWLIKENHLASDARAAEAMAEFLAVDPRDLTAAEYYSRMAELAGRYENTPLSENFKLAVAEATESLDDRAGQLAALARQWSDGDAAIEANYDLARLLLKEPVLQLKGDMQKTPNYIKNIQAGPPNPWQQRVRDLQETVLLTDTARP